MKKIYVSILVERVHRVTERLTGEEQSVFRNGRGWVNQIFTLEGNEWEKESEEQTIFMFYEFEADEWQDSDSFTGRRCGSRILNGIKIMYVDREVCVKIKKVERAWFDISIAENSYYFLRGIVWIKKV